MFVYGNTYGVVGDMLNEPAKYGKDNYTETVYLFNLSVIWLDVIIIWLSICLYGDGFGRNGCGGQVVLHDHDKPRDRDVHPINDTVP